MTPLWSTSGFAQRTSEGETVQSDTAFSHKLVERALELVLPAFNHMTHNHVVKHGHFHVTVGWTPPPNPHTDVVPVYERSFGDPSTWAMNYKVIAEGKRTIVARERVSSREAVDQDKILEGEPAWAGGVIVGDIIVTVSGLEQEFDELFAYMIAHAIMALRYNELRHAG